MFAATERQRSGGAPWFSFIKADRRVSCFYFYLWDVDFGPAFIKVCAYFPYPIKTWLNGHEWAKRQATAAGIGWTALSNGFATCDDPVGLQAICDRLGPKAIEAFFDRWMAVLPLPLTEHDRVDGYWWELSMRQIEVSVDHGVRRATARPGILRGTGGRQPGRGPTRQHRADLHRTTRAPSRTQAQGRTGLQDEGGHPRHPGHGQRLRRCGPKHGRRARPIRRPRSWHSSSSTDRPYDHKITKPAPWVP